MSQRLALCLVSFLASTGCSLSHERREADAGSVVEPDAFVSRPDAFRERDAWVAPFMMADHPPGTIVPDQGGARMAHPQLVVITFADDVNRATLEAHARWLVTSSWLTSVGAEYGIGAGTILEMVERTDAAPDTLTQTDIEAYLTAGIADHTLPTPADGTFDEALYMIYVPAHTLVTDADFGTSCVEWAGFHYEADNGGRPFPYAVVASCDLRDARLTGVDLEEETAAHELFEVASDRLPISDPAFRFSETGFTYSPWLFLGGELADLCELGAGPNTIVREGAFVAARIWSNAAARSNDRDPCVPADPAAPYFAVAVSPDEALAVAPGASTRFELTAWSTAPVADFDVQAFAGGGTFVPSVSLDASRMNNGDHATLTISVPRGTPSGSYAIIYMATVRSMTEYSYSPVVVYVP